MNYSTGANPIPPPSNLVGSAKSMSLYYEITERMNKKLSHLTEILAPVLTISDPTSADKLVAPNALIAELDNIESKITYLLDHIRI